MQCTSCDVVGYMVLWFFQISSNDCFSFTRDNFTSHNRWEKAAAWFERQNWFLRLCPSPIYGTRWDKRSLFERGRNKSGSSWPFLKPKVSYSSNHSLTTFLDHGPQSWDRSYNSIHWSSIPSCSIYMQPKLLKRKRFESRHKKIWNRPTVPCAVPTGLKLSLHDDFFYV